MAERWRDATKAACARHKVALFFRTGCKPRDSMRPWTLVLVVLRLNVVSYNTVIEGARQTDVDVTCSSVIHACVT